MRSNIDAAKLQASDAHGPEVASGRLEEANVQQEPESAPAAEGRPHQAQG